MRQDYADQLNNIEKSFYDERELILKKNDDEIK